MKKVKFLVLMLVMAIAVSSSAQEVIKPPKYPDGVYTKENSRNRRPISYTPLREADVMWSKRVWRVIDLREKINHPLYYPDEPILDRKSLFDVIREATTQLGTMTAFGNPLVDDEFRMELTKSEIEGMLVKWDSTNEVEDPNNPGTFIKAPIKNEISSLSVWKYWVKEDWFFDKQRSVLDVRIIGICPVIEKVSETGERLGADSPLFWIYFPEARPILAPRKYTCAITMQSAAPSMISSGSGCSPAMFARKATFTTA